MGMHLGHLLKGHMKAKGITSRKLAQACGVTPGAVSNWTSSGSISKEHLATACQLLGLDMASLVALEIVEVGHAQAAPAASNPIEVKHAQAEGYSSEALALAWLLDQITDRLARVRVQAAATELIAREIQQLGAAPTRKP